MRPAYFDAIRNASSPAARCSSVSPSAALNWVGRIGIATPSVDFPGSEATFIPIGIQVDLFISGSLADRPRSPQNARGAHAAHPRTCPPRPPIRAADVAGVTGVGPVSRVVPVGPLGPSAGSCARRSSVTARRPLSSSPRAGAAGLRRWTYRQLLDDAEAAAPTHCCDGSRRASTWAVWAPNSAEWLVLEFGIALAGMVLVTVNPAFRAAEVRHVLATSRAAGLFLVSEYRGNPMRATVDFLAR